MQSNTAAVGNHGVNFASFSAGNRKSDPFTVVDGHYIGHDGFVVPRNFDEFHERFPEYVRHWFKKHAGRSTPKEDVEDWTQDLLIHLNCLPANSKHRKAGKRDVVQTFDPHKHYGASSARFFNYINLCLANKFRSIRSRRMKNPLCRPGNLSLTADCEDTDRSQADDEFCHAHSEHLRSKCQRQEKQQDARLVLAEFSEFVQREDSSLLPAMKAIAAVGTWGAAAEFLGATEAEFSRTRSRLRELGRCFQTGERAAKMVQETPDHADRLPCPLAHTDMGTGSTAVRCSIPKLKIVARREFLPKNLPTTSGSYSPFQRLGSPRENVSR